MCLRDQATTHLCGPALRCVFDPQNLDHHVVHPVNDDVVRVHDHFARSALAAGPIQRGVVSQLFSFPDKQVGKLSGSDIVIVGNMHNDLDQVASRLILPFNPMHVLP